MIRGEEVDPLSFTQRLTEMRSALCADVIKVGNKNSARARLLDTAVKCRHLEKLLSRLYGESREKKFSSSERADTRFTPRAFSSQIKNYYRPRE